MTSTSSGTPVRHLRLRDGVLCHTNGVELGSVYQEVDGYWVFVFSGRRGGTGFWEGPVLREIADLLDELNYEWDQQIKNDPAVSRQPTCFYCKITRDRHNAHEICPAKPVTSGPHGWDEPELP